MLSTRRRRRGTGRHSRLNLLLTSRNVWPLGSLATYVEWMWKGSFRIWNKALLFMSRICLRPRRLSTLPATLRMGWPLAILMSKLSPESDMTFSLRMKVSVCRAMKLSKMPICCGIGASC